MVKFVVYTVWQDLFNNNLAVPPQRVIEGSLTKGLEPVPVMPIGQHHCKMCAYAHVLNLLWCPIIEYIESICRGEAPEWTTSLG